MDTREGHWRTPGGNVARFRFRPDTSDWNTLSACLLNPMADTGDEYHLPSGLTGWALDLGAHIGGVTVGLLLDNPDLRVLAIEAVPDNVRLLRYNVEHNDVAERAVIWHAAAWSRKGRIQIEFDYSGSETAEVHRYIGSVSPWIDDAPRRYLDVPSVSLRQAIEQTGGEGFGWVKSDCEGCEHKFLKGSALRKVGLIEGEWHWRDGTPDGLAAQLANTHDTTWTEGQGGGPFRAVPR